MRFVFGDCDLDTERYELRRSGRSIALEPKVFKVLTYLLQRAGRAVAKHDLLEAFWSDISDAHYKEYSLRNCLHKIRQAVGDTGTPQAMIETVRGYGYRLTAAVTALPMDSITSDGVAAADYAALRLGVEVPAYAPPPPSPSSTAASVCLTTPFADAEYKPVSVLCCALADTPLLAARLGLEGLYHLLQTVVGLAQEVTRPYNGTVIPAMSEGFIFKHALTHEVAYGSLLQERRRLLHARIVEALESCAGDRVAEQVERLAHHALRGEVWDKAVGYCRQAGEKALARSAHREAVGYFEQALSALPHLPETRATSEQAIDLRVALRSAVFPSRDLGRILAYLREAEALATALDDPRRLAQVSHFLSLHFTLMGAYDQALAAARRTLTLATAGRDGVLQALAYFHFGLAYQFQGDYRRASACFRQTVASLDRMPHHERFGKAILCSKPNARGERRATPH